MLRISVKYGSTEPKDEVESKVLDEHKIENNTNTQVFIKEGFRDPFEEDTEKNKEEESW